MDVGATNLSLPSVQRLHCKNKEKRQNVSIGQTDDSIRIPTKSRLFFIVPSTAVVTWSVIKVVREAIRIECDNTLRRPSRRHRHMSSLQKHRHESSKMSAKPLSVIRPTAIVALTRSLTRSLACSLARSLALFLGRLRCRRFRRQVVDSSLSFVDLSMEFGSDFRLALASMRRKMPPFSMKPLNCAPALPPPPPLPVVLRLGCLSLDRKPQTQFPLALPMPFTSLCANISRS